MNRQHARPMSAHRIRRMRDAAYEPVQCVLFVVIVAVVILAAAVDRPPPSPTLRRSR